jgi:Spy/CpxP family protein refolding chaperone
MRSRRILTLALAVLLALPALALAAGPAAGAGPNADQILGNPRLLARFLHLTPDQVAQEKTFATTLKNTVEPLRQARKPLYDQLETLFGATTKDACAIGRVEIDLHDNGDQIRAAYQAFDTSFSAILTPEQLTRYEALKAAAHLFGGGDTSD